MEVRGPPASVADREPVDDAAERRRRRPKRHSVTVANAARRTSLSAKWGVLVRGALVD